MVYLPLNRESALKTIAQARTSHDFVWVGADAISEEEFTEIKGVNVTRLDYPLADADAATLECALATISEHHPNQIIWVQHPVNE